MFIRRDHANGSPVLFILLAALPAVATTIHVPADQPTIAAGLATAGPGDSVQVAPGIYVEHDLVLPAGVTLRGDPTDPAGVVIDAQHLGRVLSCVDAGDDSRLEGVTLTGGLVTTASGGDYRGGGMLCDHASPILADCVLFANEAEVRGGGLACVHASPQILRCEFRANVAIDGAGLSLEYASPAIVDCLFVANDALVWGGAVFGHVEANPTLTGCTIVRNDAYSGAGIWCVGCPGVVLANCIVAFQTRGEGLHAYANENLPSAFDLACCDVFGNEAGDYGGTADDQTGVNGNLAVDPFFCDLAGGDLTLAANSPCLPAGNDCGVQMGAFGQGCDVASPVAPIPAAVFGLAPNRPNPFNPHTEIRYTLDREAAVTLRVLDPAGRLVRVLVDGAVGGAGPHTITWDGRDGAGREVPTGVYLCRLEAGGRVDTRKLLLAR